MWFLLLYLQISAIQGASVILRGSNSTCAGRLEVYHKNKWGLVCHYGWKNENGEVVCRSLGCGSHVRSGIEQTLYKDPPPPQQYWMDQVECTSEEESLWTCKHVRGANQKCDDGSFVAVVCSGEVKLRLNLNGHHDLCAGVVEFSTSEGTFRVCNDNWGTDNADKVCKELGCGAHYSINKAGRFKEQSKQNVLLTCTGDEQFSWQCMERKNAECQKQASVTCTNHRRFRLRDDSNACSGLVEEYIVEQNSWKPLQQKKERPEVICTQLNCGSTENFTTAIGTNRLTCSGSVKLNNFTTKCFGDVSINVNGTNYGVCYSDSIQSRKNMGEVVCRKLGCGNMVLVQQGSDTSDGFLSDVECQGDELSLWHCLAIHEKTQCKGTKVMCSDSLDVHLSDGLGRCSGRLEVKWEGLWRPVGSEKNNVNLDIMCGHLNCGTSSQINRELFIEGKQQWLWNVRCKSSSAKLHECFESIDLRPPHKSEKYIEVICTKEELKFFEGNSACNGKVYIEQFNSARTNTYLPAKPVEENKKKANETCAAMHCGSLDSFETNASVTCSGSKKPEPRVALQNLLGEKCWGEVKVCGDKCGGVCSKTWREVEDSKMICENLGCGKPIQTKLTSKTDLHVTYHSVYCSEKVQNMTMCNFVSNQKSSCNTPAKVICTDSVKAKLQDPRDKCAGTVSLFYAGEWTPICQDSLNTNLKNTICEELLCGKSVDDQHDRTSHEESKSTGLSRITCQDSYNSVSKCDLGQVSKKQCIAGYLKCTGWERLLLYKEGECSGPVYCLKGGTTQQVSGIGWSREEGQNLCEYLQCGNYRSHSPVFNDTKEQWKKTYNFSGNNKIWECGSQYQTIQNQQQLNIQCDRKPTNITLTNNCRGAVRIDNEHVCVSQWDDGMSDKLCDSLNCGKALSSWSTDSTTKNLQTNCLHFGCTGKETLVWQCGFKSGSCDKTLNVACKDSVEFRTTEKCGGKLGIRYKEKWEYVCGELQKDVIEKFCNVLKCNDSQEPLNEQEMEEEINVHINCPENHYKISQCVHHVKTEKCTSGPAKITCKGYIPKDGSSSVGLILGLLGGVLVLLILFLIWTNRQRLLLALRHYRNKNHKEVKPDVNEMDKMETKNEDLSEEKASFLDNDDYEDVDSLVDTSGQEEEEDDKKRGSSGTEYDDIEGQANRISASQTHHDDDLNLPLLPRRPENILDQDTYEVEIEKQGDYDDVIPVEGPDNENGGTTGTQALVDEDEGADSDLDAGLGENADALLVTTEVEVHAQPD